ncbi:MAG: hypothetical protein ABFC89_00240 [Methanospirillum sp.]
MKTELLLVSLALLLGALVVVPVGAANPHAAGTTGQPNQNCEEIFPGGDLAPAGFNTLGFAHATTVYAGAGASLEHANSPHAVSQYDVACFQQAQRMLRAAT